VRGPKGVFARGTSRVTAVPWLSAATTIRPPIRCARSRMLANPWPFMAASGSKPLPSSRTCTTSPSPSTRTSISTRVQLACRMMLWTHSLKIKNTCRRASAPILSSCVRSPELEWSVACQEHIAGKLAHPLRQKVNLVLGRVDGPDDITHGIHEFPGDHPDSPDRGVEFGIALADTASHHLAEDRHLGEARSDVVVQIGGDSGANPFHGQHLRQAVAIERVNQQAERNPRGREKPPPLPNRGYDGKGNGRGLRADRALDVQRTHLERVVSGAQAGILDGALVRRRAPIPLKAAQPILIAKPLARCEA